MALPTLYRLDILENIRDTLKAMSAGTDYRHEFREVTSHAKPVDAVPVSQCPFVMVVGGSGTQEKQLSRRSHDTVQVTIQAYVKPDQTRFPGKSSADLAEELRADIFKAIDVDPSRGQTAIFQDRDEDMTHSLEGGFSVITILDTYEFRRNF
jgi:hypothetical protein